MEIFKMVVDTVFGRCKYNYHTITTVPTLKQLLFSETTGLNLAEYQEKPLDQAQGDRLG